MSFIEPMKPLAMKYLLTAIILVLGAALGAHFVIATEPDAEAGRTAAGSPLSQGDSTAAERCGEGAAGFVSDSEFSVRRLIGMRVTNPINEQIGEVSDLMVDQCGRIKSVIVHIGGILGIGGRHVSLSLDQIRVRQSEHSAGMVVMVRRTRDHIISQGSAGSRHGGTD